MRILQLIVQNKVNITPNDWSSVIKATREGLEHTSNAFNPTDEWFGLKFDKPYELDTIADVLKSRNTDMVVLTTYINDKPQVEYNLRLAFNKVGIKVTMVTLDPNGRPWTALLAIGNDLMRYWFEEHKYFIGDLVVSNGPEAHKALYVHLKRPIPPLHENDSYHYNQVVDITQHTITDMMGETVELEGPINLHIKGYMTTRADFKIESEVSECGKYALAHFGFRDVIEDPVEPLSDEEQWQELSEMVKRNPPPHLIKK